MPKQWSTFRSRARPSFSSSTTLPPPSEVVSRINFLPRFFFLHDMRWIYFSTFSFITKGVYAEMWGFFSIISFTASNVEGDVFLRQHNVQFIKMKWF